MPEPNLSIIAKFGHPGFRKMMRKQKDAKQGLLPATNKIRVMPRTGGKIPGADLKRFGAPTPKSLEPCILSVTPVRITISHSQSMFMKPSRGMQPIDRSGNGGIL